MTLSTSFIAPPIMMSMALLRTASYDICKPSLESSEVNRASIRLKWIVVPDRNGNRRPQMSWQSK
jgi:hypothetical protein